MADEAFALSPISARPTPPSEADYEAIRAAFVETSRGRWFLGEYAQRNRNADTTMVLDAVARIEQSITAKPVPAANLADTIETIKALVAHARSDADDSLLAIERSAELASARKSARVIREIAWSLRECGTDTRICDILDAQLRGIDALHELAGSDRQADAVADVFRRLLIHIDGLADEDTQARPVPVAAHTTTIDAAPGETTREIIAPAAPFDNAPDPLDALPKETSFADAASADIAYPEDDDVLDLIAHEMAAPQDDHFEDDAIADDPIAPVQELAPPTAPALSLQPEPPKPDAPLLKSLDSSLGAALIASGVVRTQGHAGNDPLAAIRRLSQAEKIALFS